MVTTHPYFRRNLGDAFGASTGNLLRTPVLPPITGMAFLKLVAVGFAGVWLLGGLTSALGVTHGKHK